MVCTPCVQELSPLLEDLGDIFTSVSKKIQPFHKILYFFVRSTYIKMKLQKCNIFIRGGEFVSKETRSGQDKTRLDNQEGRIIKKREKCSSLLIALSKLGRMNEKNYDWKRRKDE